MEDIDLNIRSCDMDARKRAAVTSLDLIGASLSPLLLDARDHLADMQAVVGALREFHSTPHQVPGTMKYSKEMTKELLKDHEWIITQLRKSRERLFHNEEETETASLLTRMIEQHEAMAHALRKFF